MSDSEADTCRKLVVPRLQQAGWDTEPFSTKVTAEEINEAGKVVKTTVEIDEAVTDPAVVGAPVESILEPPGAERRKFYFDGGRVEIAAHLVYELDPDGKQLRVVRYTDYAAEKVRMLCQTAPEFRAEWSDPAKRAEIVRRLEERGIGFAELAEAANQPEADPFDLLCHLAFNGPLRTRRERAQRLREDRKDFFDRYGPEARTVLDELLEKYAEHGSAQFSLPDVLRVPPISEHGTVLQISAAFGGADALREAVIELQTLLYAA